MAHVHCPRPYQYLCSCGHAHDVMPPAYRSSKTDGSGIAIKIPVIKYLKALLCNSNDRIDLTTRPSADVCRPVCLQLILRNERRALSPIRSDSLW